MHNVESTHYIYYDTITILLMNVNCASMSHVIMIHELKDLN